MAKGKVRQFFSVIAYDGDYEELVATFRRVDAAYKAAELMRGCEDAKWPVSYKYKVKSYWKWSK